MKFWNFKAKKDDSSIGELTLYGDISNTSWFGDEITPSMFKNDLDSLGEIKNLNIYINSGGGDVFAGISIYNMLKRHEAYKTVYVDGIAASIASVVAMAGNKVIMPKNAMLMVHHVSCGGSGNAQYHRDLADRIDKVELSAFTAYKDKTGIDDDALAAMIEAETWMSAEEAVKKGFADEIEKDKLFAASMDGSFLMLNNQKFDLGRYKNKPKFEPTIAEVSLEEGIKLVDSMIDYESLNENRGGSQPVSDTQRDQFNKLTIKIHDYKEEN